MIKKALLKQNRHLDEEAVQAFKNVMSYMGDRKSTSKSDIDHARKLLRNLMQSPVGLRDELYLMLIKQTTKNPRVSSEIKGWELIAFCCVCFPPSKAARVFIQKYFTSAKEHKEAKVQRLASFCLDNLPKVCLHGQRMQVPSKKELECIRDGEDFTLTVHVFEAPNMGPNQYKKIPINSFTFVGEVIDLMVSKCNLTFKLPFSLYEVEDGKENNENNLHSKDRILDVLGAWENIQPLELTEEERARENAQKVQKLGHEKDYKFNKLLFKAKLMLKTKVMGLERSKILKDSECVRMLFNQAVHEYISVRYKAGKLLNSTDIKGSDEYEIAARCAAYQMQAAGNFNPEIHTAEWITQEIHKYCPQNIVAKLSKKDAASDYVRRIQEQYGKISGYTQKEAQVAYLETVQEWTYYGCQWFDISQKAIPSLTPKLLLGVNAEGIFLARPDNMRQEKFWNYMEVVNWGSASVKFVVVVGNMNQQEKLIFKTTRGGKIAELIQRYILYEYNATSGQI